jgi:hypothetical protein
VVDAVVLTVSVDGAPGFTEVGLTPHVGELAVTGETEQVSATAPTKPFSALTVIADVADAPGLTEIGVKAEAARAKLACAYFVTKASMPPPLFA